MLVAPSSTKVRVGIVEDDSFLSAALAEQLAASPEYVVVGWAESLEGAALRSRRAKLSSLRLVLGALCGLVSLACQAPPGNAKGPMVGASTPSAKEGQTPRPEPARATDTGSETEGTARTNSDGERSAGPTHLDGSAADPEAGQGKIWGDVLDPRILGDEVDIEWEDEAFAADLNADGRPEPISWSCGETFLLTVASAKVERTEKLVELRACSAAAFPIGPSTEQNQASREHGVVFCLEEHDEVGPPHCFLYRLKGGALRELWVPVGRPCFHGSGIIVSSSETCDAGRGVLEMRTEYLMWNGQGFDAKEMRAESPQIEGGCAEP